MQAVAAASYDQRFMPVISKAFFAVALILLLISVAVDFLPTRQATDLTGYTRYQGTAPWEVQQVRPGGRLSDQEVRLGPPDRTHEQYNVRTLQWTSRDLTVTANKDGVITEVLGRTLTAGADQIAHEGLGQAEVEQILGPARVKRSFMPGSGVISIGFKESGRTLGYDNGGVRFEFEVREDQVRYIRATLIAR